MDNARALELSLDATHFGLDEAAKKHAVHVSTIGRANRQVRENPALAAIALAKKRDIAERLHEKRTKALDVGLERILALMELSGVLRDVAGAYKIVADHHEIARGLDEDNGGQHHAGSDQNKGNSEPPEGAAEPSDDSEFVTISQGSA